jgi:predicted ATPase
MTAAIDMQPMKNDLTRISGLSEQASWRRYTGAQPWLVTLKNCLHLAGNLHAGKAQMLESRGSVRSATKATSGAQMPGAVSHGAGFLWSYV